MYDFNKYKNMDVEKFHDESKFIKDIANDYGYYPSNIYEDTSDTVSIWMWVGILIVLLIPVVNILLCFGLIATNNQTLKNYGKAFLILIVVIFILSFLLNINLRITL